METTTHGNIPSTSGMSNNTEGTLNKASAGAHAAVNSIAGAAIMFLGTGNAWHAHRSYHYVN